MVEQPSLKDVERRVQRAAHEDGLTELLMGAFLLLYGGALASGKSVAPFLVLPLVLVFRPLYQRAKQHLIYPRIGYVRFGPEKQADPKGILAVTAVFVAVLLGSLGLSIWIAGSDRGLDLWFTYILPPLSGLVLAIGPFWLGQTYGLTRGYVLAGLFVLSGVAIPLLDIAKGYEAVGLQCVLVGAASLASGVFMFARFLRRYQPVESPDARN